MTRYLTTRKRNIKKYKKSRTGRGKGRRSIRRCKTRKPKIFRKAKRHTVSKRRNMVGGEGCEGYMFQVKPNDVRHSKQFLDIFRNTEKTLTLIGYCIAFVTRLDGRLDGLFNADNRPEYLVFFRYGDDDIVIVRAKCPIKIAEIKFPNSVPNYTPFIIGVLRVPLNEGIVEGISENADKYNIPLETVNDLLRKLNCSNSMPQPVTSLMFNSYVITPTKGVYRIVVCSQENSPFTPTFKYEISGTNYSANDNISKILNTMMGKKDPSNEKKSVNLINGFFRRLPEIQYPSIASSISVETASKIFRTMGTLYSGTDSDESGQESKASSPQYDSQPPGGFYTPIHTLADSQTFELGALPNNSS
jgi:hypothetical protein